MNEKVPASLLPKPSAKQEAFITKYIDKNYRKKKAAKQAMLQSAWLTFVSSRDACSEVVDLVSSVARSEEDYTFVHDMRIKCADAIAKIKPSRTKGLGDATRQIVEAAEDLVALRKEARDYMHAQASGGRDLSTEAAIKLIVHGERAKLLEVKSEFSAKAEELRAKVRTEAPSVSWQPEEVAQFNAVFTACSDGLYAILKLDNEGVARTAAQAAVSAAEAERDTRLASMAEYADGDSFAMFVADMRRRDEVVVALNEVRASQEQLERWGVQDATSIASNANAIEAEIEQVFADRSGISANEAEAANTAQDALLGRAVALGRTASSAIRVAEGTFTTEIDKLRPQVERLEQRWVTCKGDVGKRQSAPIIAQIAAMRLALDGLGGCNTAAIDAIKKMIKESTDLVLQAENIGTLNDRIIATLKDADKEAKALTGKTNPIAADFTAHIKAIGEYKDGFKEKPLNDAVKGADDLLAKVRADAQRNQDLITRRAEIQARIVKRETQLADFNSLFREMLEHAGQPVKDYRGSFQADIETCKNWAATKTDPAFYDTIDAKLTSILTEMEREAGNIRLMTSKSNQELMLDAATAATTLRDANLDLNGRDGEALARLAEAQALLQDIQRRLEAGEEVPPTELTLAEDALAEANGARGEIADARADAKKAYDKTTHLLDCREQLVSELARAEAADAMALRKKEEFIEVSKLWLTEIKTEVGSSENILSDYKDEADPQIERVATARKMLKEDKPGVTGASALSELEFVKKFLTGLRQRGRKTDRRYLGDIGDQWDKEITKISNAASKLITVIEEFENFPDVDGTASADVERMFGVILGRMQDHVFEQAAKTFNDSEDKQTRKGAREQALSEVRRFRALMFKDPLLQKCVMNPFGVPVGSTTANRLEEIELNVLRGI